jgi:flagellar biogenesis protein FliO
MATRTAAFLFLIFCMAGTLSAGDYSDDQPLPASFTAEASAEGEPVVSEQSSVTGLVLRAGAGLLIVALVTAGGVWVLRRNPNMKKYFGGAGVVRVLTRTYLGSKTSVYLLKVGDRVVLVGSAPSGLTALTEITNPTEVTRLIAETESKPAKAEAEPKREFRQTLKESISPPEMLPMRRDRLDTSAPTRAVRSTSGEETEGARKLAAIRAELDRMQSGKVGA